MGTYEKDLRKIWQNPKNVHFQTLENILLGLGFKERKGRDFVFTKEGHILIVPAHGKNPILKEVYVKKAYKCLCEMGIYDEDEWDK